MRQLKREVKIGNVTIGGKNPIAVQTMLNVPVEDIEGNVAQAKRCEAAGCQILRVTCPSAADAKCIEAVKNAGYTTVVLRPLMVVAGDHANNDMAGADEDSWKTMFEAAGLTVNCQISGLGRIADVQALYVAHTKAAIDAIA